MKTIVICVVVILFSTTLLGQSEAPVTDDSHLKLFYSLIGGFVGGVLGVIGTILSSYYGPKRLEMWRMKQKEKREDGPRKKLLLQMLEDTRFPDGRKLTTLSRVTGTGAEECRRLLIGIKARGVTLKDEDNQEVEGWALITKKPLIEK